MNRVYHHGFVCQSLYFLIILLSEYLHNVPLRIISYVAEILIGVDFLNPTNSLVMPYSVVTAQHGYSPEIVKL